MIHEISILYKVILAKHSCVILAKIHVPSGIQNKIKNYIYTSEVLGIHNFKICFNELYSLRNLTNYPRICIIWHIDKDEWYHQDQTKWQNNNYRERRWSWQI